MDNTDPPIQTDPPIAAGNNDAAHALNSRLPQGWSSHQGTDNRFYFTNSDNSQRVDRITDIPGFQRPHTYLDYRPPPLPRGVRPPPPPPLPEQIEVARVFNPFQINAIIRIIADSNKSRTGGRSRRCVRKMRRSTMRKSRK